MNTEKYRFPLVLEAFVLLFYVALYKYGYYLQLAALPNKNFENFPHPSLIVYAIAMTLYIIPFYRILAPRLLQQKKYTGMLVLTILYFALVPKFTNWIVAYFFMKSSAGDVQVFYLKQWNLYKVYASHLTKGWDFKVLLTDCVAFLSLTFTRYAFAVEQGKRLIEKEYFRLQVEALKAPLNPHFLFNMLNSIYGMSLAGSKDTPSYILRMSDMMRYILYDGREATVPLDKDLQFLENYIAMEQKRYPDAKLNFTFSNGAPTQPIVPLLLLPFIENSFKHGAYRVNDTATVKGKLNATEDVLTFTLVNDILRAGNKNNASGVGLENVLKRLQVHYPGRYVLTMNDDGKQYSIKLEINFT